MLFSVVLLVCGLLHIHGHELLRLLETIGNRSSNTVTFSWTNQRFQTYQHLEQDSIDSIFKRNFSSDIPDTVLSTGTRYEDPFQNVMAGSVKVDDSEKLRHVDRVMAIAFREARVAGANFITKKWVANKLKMSEPIDQRLEPIVQRGTANILFCPSGIGSCNSCSYLSCGRSAFPGTQ